MLCGGGPHAQLAAHIAATLGTHHDASITVFHATSANRTERDDFTAQFDRIREIAVLGGARNVYQRSGSADSIADAIVKESTRGYDAIFAGASQTEGDSALGGDVLRELVRRSGYP